MDTKVNSYLFGIKVKHLPKSLWTPYVHYVHDVSVAKKSTKIFI